MGSSFAPLSKKINADLSKIYNYLVIVKAC